MSTRVNLEDTVADMIIKISEGNPGAITVLRMLMRKDDELGFMHVLSLDEAHIYGSDIWILYKDICGEDIDRMIYHIQMELPTPTGELWTTGPYAVQLMNQSAEAQESWSARRSDGPINVLKKGSNIRFWALREELVPDTPHYVYPIDNWEEVDEPA